MITAVMATATIMATAIVMATAMVTGIPTITSRGLLALLLLCLAACAEPPVPSGNADANIRKGDYLYGRVTRIADGDTLTMTTTDGRALRIRLAEIDTPEKDQPFSNRARQRLSELVRDRDIAVRLFDVDTYGRIVGRVYVGDIDVCALLVGEGLAVVYRRYAEDPQLFALETQARSQKLGLWAGDDIPRGGRSGEPRPSTEPGQRSPECGSKRYCREMTSCEEARFYLRECGLGGMDGDRDGVPCEQGVCR